MSLFNYLHDRSNSFSQAKTAHDFLNGSTPIKQLGWRERLFDQNSNWKTFGLNAKLSSKHETIIQNIIEEVNSKFNLVMITEYLVESLILLRHVLGTIIFLDFCLFFCRFLVDFCRFFVHFLSIFYLIFVDFVSSFNDSEGLSKF